MWSLLSFSAGVGVASLGAILTSSWLMRRVIRRVRSAERRARAAERMADLGSLTGGLAHEIKNPLSTIGLNAQLLAEGIADLDADPDAKGRLTRRVEALKREAERLRGILADFLDYAGSLRLNPSPTDVNQILRQLIDFFTPQASGQGVHLRADLSDGALIACVDTPALKQAVLNLLLNAVQAMPAGAQDIPARELIIRTVFGKDADHRACALIHVIDTGPGIPPETLARIFEPYFTTKPGGTGLGLPTTKRLIESTGGRLDVYSDVGKGSAFVISLPTSQTQPSTRTD